MINISADYDNYILRNVKLKLAAVDYQSSDKIFPNNVLERRLENINLLDDHIVMCIKHSLKNALDELINNDYADDKFKLDITHNILNIVTDSILEKYLK